MPDQDGARIDARALLSGQERLEIQGRPVLLSHSFAFAVCRSVCAQRLAPPRKTKNFVFGQKLDLYAIKLTFCTKNICSIAWKSSFGSNTQFPCKKNHVFDQDR